MPDLSRTCYAVGVANQYCTTVHVVAFGIDPKMVAAIENLAVKAFVKLPPEDVRAMFITPIQASCSIGRFGLKAVIYCEQKGGQISGRSCLSQSHLFARMESVDPCILERISSTGGL